MIFVVVIAIICALMLHKCSLYIQPHQRVVVLYLGRYQGVLSPGFNLIKPFVDMPVWVDLNKHINNWQQLDEKAIQHQVSELVIENPDPNKYR